MRRVLAVAMVVVALVFGTVARPAEARSVGNPIGAGGDAGDLVECPVPNEVLVGFTGRTGLWIDQIQLECAKLFADGSVGAPHPSGKAYGGGGGGPSGGTCNSGRITDIAIELTGDSKKVASITFACVDRSGQRSQGFFGGSQAETASSHQSCGLFMGCDPNSINTPTQGCSNGEPSTGLSVRYGAHVNAVGLVCDQRQPVAVAAAAPAPIPAKPIKSTRRGGATTSSGSAVALRATIAGLWDFAASDRDTIQVQIIAQGSGIGINGADIMPIQVNGLMTTSGDDGLSGTFSGMLQPDRQMIVSYTQKNGGTGTCQLFYSADATAIGGTCVDQAKNTFQWHGARSSGVAAAAPRVDRGALHAVAVKLDVDVYPAAGGEGQSIGSLNAGTEGVTLVEACRDNWCHVRWGDREGWVYSGPDYNSLGQ